MLNELMAGNKRYTDGNFSDKNRDLKRRNEIANGQHPFAAIVCCSDSRVCPEILFDQGLGDIFVVRVAGNIADYVVIGSLEYAIEHLHVPLVMVLGHSKCGAVSATCQGGEVSGHIGHLTGKILPAVEKSRASGHDHADECAKENVRLVVENLKNDSHVISEFLNKGTLQVVGAFYDLDSGVVSTVE
ncbi:MAG: carbonic anhydrase [Candidatus Gracilibacteria bacterium]|jgi:carbonic anhydrase